ncbi:MAG TPA: endopeptidase La [bacterium]|nr:endopeptidase La [bacterium]
MPPRRRAAGTDSPGRSPGGKPDNQTILVPFLPLRDVVVFPQMVVPVFVGRPASIVAVEKAMRADRKLFVAAQIDPRSDDPSIKEIYHYGVIAEILQVLKLPDNSLKVLIEGGGRARLLRLVSDDGCAMATTLPEEYPVSASVTVRALMRTVTDQFGDYVKLNRRIPPEVIVTVMNLDDPGQVADAVCANLVLRVADKQALLEIIDPVARLRQLSNKLHGEIEIMTLEKQIRQQVGRQIEESQKEFYLNEQLKAIQKELGKNGDHGDEIRELEEKLAAAQLPGEAEARARKELKRLEKLQPMSAEAGVVRTYLDWLVELPWTVKELPAIDLGAAEQLLDAEHFGLEDAKKRILEYLAVVKLVGKVKGQILCFAGPPGVGKTSVARAIAQAMGREFVRLSLGGVRDEAEIRGHRRTYVGALPGRILQSLHKVKSRNPVFLLDEIDKMSTDFRGDPSAALLEVLDPEQNAAFSDHYLEVTYDLSEVFFITTANNIHAVPIPLHDRMEVIRFPGYSEFEKLQIAQRFLVGKQLAANGLTAANTSFAEPALKEIIRHYTREAGVRNLERELAAVCRKRAFAAVKAAEGDARHAAALCVEEVTVDRVHAYLGVPRYRSTQAAKAPAVGVACGLAWTETGGDILNIEAAVLRGKGGVQLTGQLGEVMKESAQAAISYTRAHAVQLRISADFYRTRDLHIHVPEGAIPKNGPSAGVTMATAVVSALTGRKVRHDLAMTGEITLHGEVLPVGGIKEKVLAAQRAGLTEVVMPHDNEKDFKELPERERKRLTVHYVKRIDDVLKLALLKK